MIKKGNRYNKQGIKVSQLKITKNKKQNEEGNEKEPKLDKKKQLNKYKI